jgi:acyl-CoA thioesterase-1
MRSGGLMVIAAMGLTACGGEPTAGPQAEPVRQRAAMQDGQSAEVSGPAMRILAFGDSLFAGYGLQAGEGYPERLEAALRARGINARVSNAGVSGDTTAAGRQRIAFVLENEEEVPDLAIVELGGNDLLRAIPPEQTRENLDAILAELDRRGIPVLLMGMRAPPNLGPGFVQTFDAIYPALAEKYDAALVPFFLDSVWTRPDLIQPDRVHPTAQGIEAMVAATLDEVVEALPEDEAAAAG